MTLWQFLNKSYNHISHQLYTSSYTQHNRKHMSTQNLCTRSWVQGRHNCSPNCSSDWARRFTWAQELETNTARNHFKSKKEKQRCWTISPTHKSNFLIKKRNPTAEICYLPLKSWSIYSLHSKMMCSISMTNNDPEKTSQYKIIQVCYTDQEYSTCLACTKP